MSNDPNASPLAYFASELKRLRKRAGMTQTQVAEKTNYALATVSSYETATAIPSAGFAKRADKVFGTDCGGTEPGDLERLQAMVEHVSVRPWFRDRVEAERKALEIREYEAHQIPGLLQTESYARAVMSASRPTLPDEAIERGVALRMMRQQILVPDGDRPADQEHTPRLWAIVDESALYRLVESAEVMKAQREHLAAMMRLPHVTVQVIPMAKGATPAFGRAFAVLVSKNASALIYLEDIGTARYIRERDEVQRYLAVFDYMRASALYDEQSLRLIEGVK